MSDSGRAATGGGRGELRPPEPPRDPALEFLSRSWSASGAADVSRRALAGAPPPPPPAAAAAVIAEDVSEELDVDGSAASGSSFSFASAATSQLIMDRIMSQSQEVSPLTSGRLSHSSGPLNGGGSLSDSPPVSPDVDDNKFCRAVSTPKPQPYRGVGGGGGGKTVGRWLKERKEKKKEETRAHNAQVHAAVSVAAVAAAVAAVAAATAAASGSGRDDRAARTDMAVASAATLVAAQCVEAAESLGAERDHLAAAVASAVNVRTPGDIVTITAAAATALRGAATLKARALKDVWNVAAVIPVEKNAIAAAASGGNHHHKHNAQKQQQQQHHHRHHGNGSNTSSSFSDDVAVDDDDDENNFLTICSQELLARGTELLKRTRKGALHWKVVSVYIHRTGVVMLKMKSRHVAGTLTKKKKNVVVDVCRDVAAWPGRHLLEGGEHRRYFGLRTAEHRVIEFECSSQREHDMWTKGVARLLATVDGRRKRFT